MYAVISQYDFCICELCHLYSSVRQTLLNDLIKRMGSVYFQLWCQMLFIVLVVFEEDYSVLEKSKTR